MALGGGLYAMPMVIINMGGEMVYILAQRLQAQNVPEDKSKRVLQDVVRTMYNKMFIDELFRPQDVYSMAATRQIFDRLAHSSIMRLNESSMDKLFDLMTMGFKYQMLACSYPQELMHVTLNHLYNLRAKVEEADSVTALIDDAIKRSHDQYASMTPFEFAGLKQTLCRFFANKRVKVSLFLQDGIQKNDGTITLKYDGLLPPGVERPGKIQYVDVSGAPLGTDSFMYPGSGGLIDDTNVDKQGHLAWLEPRRQLACALGHNLYTKESPAVASAAAYPPPPRVDSAVRAAAILAADSKNARSDLNLLADLIVKKDTSGAMPPLNLFPESSMPGSGGGSGAVGGTQMITIDITRDNRAMAQSNRELVGVMSEFDDVNLRGDDGGDDDALLGLLPDS